MIKAVLFDFHKVIVNDFTKKSEKDFCKQFKMSPKRFHDAQKASQKIDIASNSEKKFFQALILESGSSLSAKEVENFFEKADIKNIKFRKGLLEHIKKLKKYYIVGLASNVSEGLSLRLERMNSYRVFENNYRFLSHSIGFAKPDRKFFEYILKKLKLKPAEVIFVDDRPANIEKARHIGLHGIAYKNIKSFKKELTAKLQ